MRLRKKGKTNIPFCSCGTLQIYLFILFAIHWLEFLPTSVLWDMNIAVVFDPPHIAHQSRLIWKAVFAIPTLALSSSERVRIYSMHSHLQHLSTGTLILKLHAIHTIEDLYVKCKQFCYTEKVKCGSVWIALYVVGENLHRHMIWCNIYLCCNFEFRYFI